MSHYTSSTKSEGKENERFADTWMNFFQRPSSQAASNLACGNSCHVHSLVPSHTSSSHTISTSASSSSVQVDSGPTTSSLYETGLPFVKDIRNDEHGIWRRSNSPAPLQQRRPMTPSFRVAKQPPTFKAVAAASTRLGVTDVKGKGKETAPVEEVQEEAGEAALGATEVYMPEMHDHREAIREDPPGLAETTQPADLERVKPTAIRHLHRKRNRSQFSFFRYERERIQRCLRTSNQALFQVIRNGTTDHAATAAAVEIGMRKGKGKVQEIDSVDAYIVLRCRIRTKGIAAEEILASFASMEEDAVIGLIDSIVAKRGPEAPYLLDALLTDLEQVPANAAIPNLFTSSSVTWMNAMEKTRVTIRTRMDENRKRKLGQDVEVGRAEGEGNSAAATTQHHLPNLFGALRGSERLEMILSALVRAYARYGWFSTARISVPSSSVQKLHVSSQDCARIARLAASASVSISSDPSPSRVSLPLALASLNRADLRYFLSRLTRSLAPDLLHVVEAMRRRLEGSSSGGRRRNGSLIDQATDAGFPTLREGTSLMAYYLHPNVMPRRGTIPSALKLFRRLLLTALGTSSTPNSLRNSITKSEADAKILLTWSVSPAQSSRSDTVRVTLRLAMLRLALKRSAGAESSVLLNELVQDLQRGKQSRETEAEAAASSLLALLCDEVLSLQASFQSIGPLLSLSQAIVQLPVTAIQLITPSRLAQFVMLACSMDASNLAADCVCAYVAASPHPHPLSTLRLDKKTTLRVLLSSASRFGREENVQRMTEGMTMAEWETQEDRFAFLEVLARANLQQRAMELYGELPADTALPPRCIARMVKMLVRKDAASREALLNKMFSATISRYGQGSIESERERLDASTLMGAALLLDRREEAERQVKRIEESGWALDQTDLGIQFRDFAQRDAAGCTRLLISAANGTVHESSEIPCLVNAIQQGTPLTEAFVNVFRVLWKAEELVLLQKIYTTASILCIPLGSVAEPFALLQRLGGERPLTAAQMLRSVESKEFLAAHAGILSWLCQAFAQNASVQQALKQVPDKTERLALAHRFNPTDMSLHGAMIVFRLLFESTGIVDLSTLSLLLFKLRTSSAKLKFGHGLQERQRWIDATRDLIVAARTAPSLRPSLPLGASARVPQQDQAVEEPNVIPRPLLLRAAKTLDAFGDSVGAGQVRSLM